MLTPFIKKLLKLQALTSNECESAFDIVFSGAAETSQIAALLVLLRAKIESCDEIMAMVTAARKTTTIIPLVERTLDIVGTGGDGKNTINVSTGAAILAASCSVKIAKHGNRAVTSRCGSADLLAELGVNINLQPAKIAECINKIGMGFYFSANCYQYPTQLKEIRKSLKIPTSFNLIGPLLNPACANHYLMGVYSLDLIDCIADAVSKLTTHKSFVFHGSGIDEISSLGITHVIEVKENKKRYFEFNPKDYGFKFCTLSDLSGGSANYNAKKIRDALSGDNSAIADTLIINAAMAVLAFGITDSLTDAIAFASQQQKNGSAIMLLDRLIKFSQGESHE